MAQKTLTDEKRPIVFRNYLLPAERAALSQSGLATGRLAKNRRTTSTDDDGLGV